jgi:hypothetical protein
VLACGFGLVANLEAAALAGCRIDGGRVHVDEAQRTTVADTFAAGELTGVAGAHVALLEGLIAGAAATEQPIDPRLALRRQRHLRLADALARAFELRADLRALADEGTVLCRCEDVAVSKLEAAGSWREARILTRCGMGPCQGRVCGAAAAFLKGWEIPAARPPLVPIPAGALGEALTEAGS